MRTDNNSLADLYRRLGHIDLPTGLDAGTLVAHAAGQLPAAAEQRVARIIASSPRLTQLLALLRDLAPASEQLAQAVQAQSSQQHRGHAVPVHALRATRQHRHVRWLGVAAVLLVALVGMWGWQRMEMPSHNTSSTAAAPASQPQLPDSIFNNGMDNRLAASRKPAADQIFRASFNNKQS